MQVLENTLSGKTWCSRFISVFVPLMMRHMIGAGAPFPLRHGSNKIANLIGSVQGQLGAMCVRGPIIPGQNGPRRIA
jgi:hypothetical protein